MPFQILFLNNFQKEDSVMKNLEKRINYKFKEKSYLMEALTHSSFANERGGTINCNERMEFLGDSVLSIISSEFLFKNFPDLPEGELSRLRSNLVCTESLSGYARKIDLGRALFLGKGEIHTGGYDRNSILEDAFEALIAAIYLDAGMDTVRDFVLPFFKKELKNDGTRIKDYKTKLQEVVQQNPDEHVTYVLVGESGPAHDKTFEIEVRINSNVIGKGKGKSKKLAEQAAAKEALELMGI